MGTIFITASLIYFSNGINSSFLLSGFKKENKLILKKVNIFFFFFLFLFSGFHMTPKLNKIFPESCLLIVVGVVIGLLLYLSSSVHVSPLTPDTFFLYMLPPIILDAGYFMPNRLFFDHLGTILLFAVVGTIFNTLTIGKYFLFYFYSSFFPLLFL